MVGVGMQRRNLTLARTTLLHVRHGHSAQRRKEIRCPGAHAALEISAVTGATTAAAAASAAVEIDAVGSRRYVGSAVEGAAGHAPDAPVETVTVT